MCATIITVPRMIIMYAIRATAAASLSSRVNCKKINTQNPIISRRGTPAKINPVKRRNDIRIEPIKISALGQVYNKTAH